MHCGAGPSEQGCIAVTAGSSGLPALKMRLTQCTAWAGPLGLWNWFADLPQAWYTFTVQQSESGQAQPGHTQIARGEFSNARSPVRHLLPLR